MTAYVFFSLSALFLKKVRKIVSEKLHPCPHVLEYLHQFQIYCLNLILDGLNFMAMNLMGFLWHLRMALILLKALKQPVRNIENT